MGHNSYVLREFETGSAELSDSHKQCLDWWVASALSAEYEYVVSGLASRLRFREGDSNQRNVELSYRRAANVYAYIEMSILLEASNGWQRRLPPNELIRNISFTGVGTSLSQNPQSDEDDEWHRSVIITPRRINRIRPGPDIGGERPLPTLTDEFWIKYVSGVEVGAFKLSGIECAQMCVRDANNYYQKYYYVGWSVGTPGSPLEWGDGCTPGLGWARFETRGQFSVDSFTGRAKMLGASAQIGIRGDVGVGGDFTLFYFGRGKSKREPRFMRYLEAALESGAGFDIGLNISDGLLFKAGTPVECGDGWLTL